MVSAEDQDVVQAFPASSPDPSFREGVRPGGLDRRLGDPDVLGLEYLIERTGELGVAVADLTTNAIHRSRGRTRLTAASRIRSRLRKAGPRVREGCTFSDRGPD